ncbi:LLM class flavin-dependent oxidoreductase [Niallia sp. NCCP-28]|uniref:LLM class flavin-dependent oxidoreductase n=1 Tax=Niallia sp. NCCP-28 TaxID=2934712 RepID=UPI002089CE2C|nr:LLM class flavin-dependent oxidoreductase [Niallia sp. NCCP-28]GKU84723.1 alkanesulfonate monooxygenase [Niallia sp. NCCP-28]
MNENIKDVEFGWFIPVRGDGRYVGVEPEREPTMEYLIKVAQAAENAGFSFALIPTGRACVDSWIIGTVIASHTKSLRPLVAMRPGLIAPVAAARMGASLDVASNGRAMFNIVTGHSAQDLKETGDPLFDSHDERYERTSEFLNIVRTLWEKSKGPGYSEFSIGKPKNADEDKLDFNGKYYSLEGTISYPAAVQMPHPPIYFGGSSAIGKRVAVETADVYLMWAEPVDWIKEQIKEVEGYRAELEKNKGIKRSLRYGLRAHVLVRETEEEAWNAAWEIISKVDQATIEKADEKFSTFEAVGQKRQNQLRSSSREKDYMVAPNLWSGLSLVRDGGSLLFVGTPEQITERFSEYIEAGISTFILSGYPHLEEATNTGRLLLPLIKEKLSAKYNVSFNGKV